MGNSLCKCFRHENTTATGQSNPNEAYTHDDNADLRKLSDVGLSSKYPGNERLDSDRYTVQPRDVTSRNTPATTSAFDNDALSLDEITVNEGKQLVRGLYDYISEAYDDDDDQLNFNAGDVMEIIEKNGEWWKARNIETGEEGYIPSNFVIPEILVEKILSDFVWYHGKISRKTADQFLLEDYNKAGVFLIRESDNTPGSHALSVLHDRGGGQLGTKHYRIVGSEAEGYHITPIRPYATLEEFVEGYLENSDGLCCSLSRPCPKQKPQIYDLSKNTRDNWEISKDQLEFIEIIGQGYFGEVWKGKWKGRINVAIKKLKEGTMLPHKFLAEAVVMKQLRHDNLVTLLAVCSTEPLYIISELLRESLQQYLKRKKDLDHLDILDIAHQIAEGMAYMDMMKYIHRDLAARNILMVNDTQIKIADFGLARALIDEDSETYCAEKGVKLPLKWTAPESVLKNEFTIKSDVWSYGIVLVELTSRGAQPYPGIRGQDIIAKLQNGHRHHQPSNCPDTLYASMQLCWDEDPKQRPTFDYLRIEMAEHLRLLSIAYE